VPMFQEQVLKIAMVMADFSGSEAEELRRAMGFHRSHEKMRRVEAKLRAALQERDVNEETTERIVKVIGSFALYGFPESHAISFGLLAYASSYLKVHRGAEFYTGLLNNQPMGFYSSSTLVQEAKRRGLRFLPPCVVLSGWRCEVLDDDLIRLGLLTVRGLDEVSVEQMIAEREKEPFRSLEDFRQRGQFDRRQLRQLAAVGALNDYTLTRRRAIWAVEEPELEQGDLFADPAKVGSHQETEEMKFPLSNMSYVERVKADFSGLGLTTGKHPMCLVRPRLPVDVLPAGQLSSLPDGVSVMTAGAVICRQRPGTAKGVVFITLEDETGLSNSIVYPDKFEECRLTITTEPFLQITGKVQRSGETLHIMAEKITALRTGDTLPAGASHDFH